MLFITFAFVEEYLQLTFDKSVFKISAILHPSTYLNKILLGSEQGSLQLWNVKSKWALYLDYSMGGSCLIYSYLMGNLSLSVLSAFICILGGLSINIHIFGIVTYGITYVKFGMWSWQTASYMPIESIY